MKPLSELDGNQVEIIFCDIDDTLTDKGQLHDNAYSALWELHRSGKKIVPITGRPAGWCELIARLWPVDGIIGENGAFYFKYDDKKMSRHFVVDEPTRLKNSELLSQLREKIIQEVPGVGIASDQFCRLFDLAIDFCEDVPPLPHSDILKIVELFHKAGATAKVSSIHVNGWFGDYDKLSMCKTYCEKEFQIDISKVQRHIAFIGDSPNDEPMFGYFENSVAVANIEEFEDQLKELPKYKATQKGGSGFAEFAKQIL